MRLQHLLLFTISAVWLAGCQVAPTAPSTHGKDATTLTHWQADGRFAYRTQSDGGNASIHWQQKQEQGTLTFSGPMGFGSAAMQSHPTAAFITTKDVSFNAPSVELLAEEFTCIAQPVDAFMYWFRAVPWPLAEARIARTQHVNTLQ